MLVTCRCYELRCQTGVVAGNYSSGNTLVPYAIAPSELKPVYDFRTVSSEPPADSFGRVFPGNVLNSSQVLFTDCWNTTDSPVWTPYLHLCVLCTAAGMHAGAGQQSVRSLHSYPAHMHVFKEAWGTRLFCLLLHVRNMLASQWGAYCIYHNTYDPGTSPGSANQCTSGNVYLRSNLSRKPVRRALPSLMPHGIAVHH